MTESELPNPGDLAIVVIVPSGREKFFGRVVEFVRMMRFPEWCGDPLYDALVRDKIPSPRTHGLWVIPRIWLRKISPPADHDFRREAIEDWAADQNEAARRRADELARADRERREA